MTDNIDDTTVDTTMEECLASTERAVDGALRVAGSTVSALKKALAGARTGQVRELRRALADAQRAASDLAQQARAIDTGFTFNEQEYLSSGAYQKELLAAADAAGIAVFEEDDRLLCYPSLIRVVSSDAAVQIDKVKERRLRPSVLVAQLVRNQEKTRRFKAEGFLDALRQGYDLVIARDGKKADGVAKLIDVWKVLTILPGPGGKYSKQEFARDLYLLDQSGVTFTPRDQRRLRLSASTGTKGGGALVTVSRTGQQQLYWGVSFAAVPEGAAPA